MNQNLVQDLIDDFIPLRDDVDLNEHAGYIYVDKDFNFYKGPRDQSDRFRQFLSIQIN